MDHIYRKGREIIMSRKEIYLGMLRRELQGCTEEF